MNFMTRQPLMVESDFRVGQVGTVANGPFVFVPPDQRCHSNLTVIVLDNLGPRTCQERIINDRKHFMCDSQISFGLQDFGS